MILPLRADGLRQSWMRECLEGLWHEPTRGNQWPFVFALALDVSLDEFLHPKAKKVATEKPNRRVLRRMEKIESLPFHQQTRLLKSVDGFLKGVGVTL